MIYFLAAFKKKVSKVAKLKGCDIIGEWVRSMVNYLYWCALSTKDGDIDVILEKWLSLIKTNIEGIARSTRSVHMDGYITESGLNIVRV